MGIKLVGLVLTRWAAHVSDRAFRVLTRMAATALDEPSKDTPASLYFGGRELLASALNSERNGTPESALRTVKRAIAELIDVGAIRRTNKAYAGVNQVYELRLWDAIRIDGRAVDNSAKGDTSGTPEGDSTGTPVGDTSGPKWGTPRVPPRNKEEPLEERYEDEGVDLREPVAVARARDAPKFVEETPPDRCDQPTCSRGFVLVGDPPRIERCPKCHSNVIPFPDRRSA